MFTTLPGFLGSGTAPCEQTLWVYKPSSFYRTVCHLLFWHETLLTLGRTVPFEKGLWHPVEHRALRPTPNTQTWACQVPYLFWLRQKLKDFSKRLWSVMLALSLIDILYDGLRRPWKDTELRNCVHCLPCQQGHKPMETKSHPPPPLPPAPSLPLASSRFWGPTRATTENHSKAPSSRKSPQESQEGGQQHQPLGSLGEAEWKLSLRRGGPRPTEAQWTMSGSRGWCVLLSGTAIDK